MSEQILEWLRAFGGLSFQSGLALAAVFVFGNMMFFPRTFVLLGSGAIFGAWAIPIIWPSMALGAILAFLLSRFVLADFIQRRLDGYPMARAIADAVDAEGWKIVALFRLGGPISASMQNYLFGVTRIGFVPYAVATTLFIIPQIVLFVYMGAAGRTALETGETPGGQVAALLALGSLVLIFWMITNKTRAVMRAHAAKNPNKIA